MPEVHTGRWGSVAQCVCRLQGRVQAVLQKCWHLDVFCFRPVRDPVPQSEQPVDDLDQSVIFGDVAAADSDQPDAKKLDSASLKTLDRAIKSDWFWAYVAMISVLAETLIDIMGWAEACPCHHQASSSVLQWLPPKACPMKGRRAPELAAGECQKFILSVLGNRGREVLMACAPWLSKKSDQKRLVREFGYCRNHVAFVLTLKLRAWELLPLKISGLAHPCQATAKRVASELVAQLTSEPSKFGAHPVSSAFKDSQELEDELRAFAAEDTSLTSLPKLSACVAPLLFIPVTERLVEGTHAAMKREITRARNAGLAHLALNYHLPELTSHLENEPESLAMLAKVADTLRSPMDVVRALGFEHHPQIQHCLADAKWNTASFNRSAAGATQEVVYHADLGTMCQAASCLDKVVQGLQRQQKEVHPQISEAWALACLESLRNSCKRQAVEGDDQHMVTPV